MRDWLQDEVKGKLVIPTATSTKNDLEAFLTRLYDMYSKWVALAGFWMDSNSTKTIYFYLEL